MKITKMLSQHRRDFTAEITCEFCGHVEKLNDGYDDSYYHNEVLPNFECEKCGKSTISGDAPIEPQQTRYPDGFQI